LKKNAGGSVKEQRRAEEGRRQCEGAEIVEEIQVKENED
jgi:hypothetical protein